MLDPRHLLCSVGARVVPELSISGRRAALARRLLPGPSDDVAVRSVAGVDVNVGASSEAERLLAHWHRPLARGYGRTPLGRVLAGAPTRGTFADVGSNLGLYAILGVAAGWDVVRVEPDERLRGHHERNPALGPFLPLALAATSGVGSFYSDAANLGAASLVTVSTDRAADQEVQVATADEALGPLLPTDRTVLLKVDVEGAEVDTISGATGVLADVAPVVWCEVRGSASNRARSTDVVVMERLAAAGYWIGRVGEGGIVPVDGGSDAGVYDIVGLPSEGPSAPLGEWIRTARFD